MRTVDKTKAPVVINVISEGAACVFSDGSQKPEDDPFMSDLITTTFFAILAAGFFVGVVVGLTGMGGGALMTPVQAPLKTLLEKTVFKAPAAPVVTNVEAEPNADPARIVSLLVAQVTAPVRWVESVQRLRALGVERFVELGPGRVLSGLIKRIDRAAAVFNVEDPPSLEKTEAGLRA